MMLLESVVLVAAEAVLAVLVVTTVAADKCSEACAWCAAACKCATAWWATPIWAGVTRSSRLSHDRTTWRGRRAFLALALPTPKIISPSLFV